MNSKALKAITVATLSISMVSGCATTAPGDADFAERYSRAGIFAIAGAGGNTAEQKAFAELTHSVCTKAKVEHRSAFSKSDPRYITQCANLMNVQRANELNVNVR